MSLQFLPPDQQMSDDGTLVESILGGDEDAARVFFNRFRNLVKAIARRYSGSETAVDDFAQEMWLHIFLLALPAWEPERGPLNAFVASAAANKAIDLYRRVRRSATTVELDGLMQSGKQFSDERLTVAGDAIILAIRDCIEKMDNVNHRRAIELFLIGYKYDQIVEALGAESIKTVGTWIHRAKTHLRVCLERAPVAVHLRLPS